MTFEDWADRIFGTDFKKEESLTYFRMSAAWDAASMDSEQQRDELLAALKEIAEIENETYGADWDEIDKARGIANAAIAKADLTQ